MTSGLHSEAGFDATVDSFSEDPNDPFSDAIIVPIGDFGVMQVLTGSQTAQRGLTKLIRYCVATAPSRGIRRIQRMTRRGTQYR